MYSWVCDVQNVTVRREVGRALPIVALMIVAVAVVLALPHWRSATSPPDSSEPSTRSPLTESPNAAPFTSLATPTEPPADHLATQSLSLAGVAEDAILGVVLDSVGDPIADARVTLVRTDAADCPRARYAQFCDVDPEGPVGLRTRTDENGRFQCLGLDEGVDYDVFVDLQGAGLWSIEACELPLAVVRAGAPAQTFELPYGIVEVALTVPESLADLRDEDGSFDVEVSVDRGPEDRDSIRGVHPDRLRIAAPFEQPFDIVVGGRGVREVRRSSLMVTREDGVLPVEIALEPEAQTGRILVSVVDEEMQPVTDVWLHKVTRLDPPAFEYVRIGEGTDAKRGFYVLDGLEPRSYTICALGDSYGDRAPAFATVDVAVGESRELLLVLRRGEFLELSFKENVPELSFAELVAPDLDYEIGHLIDWSLARRTSFGTYRTYEPGEIYRSSIRVPLGTYQLRLHEVDGKEWLRTVEVEEGRVARVQIGIER